MKENRICPETHLTKAIIVTVFCCLPFGIASIMFASKVASCFAIGNYQEAMEKSKEANKWANIGIIAGLIYYIIYIVIILVCVINEL